MSLLGVLAGITGVVKAVCVTVTAICAAASAVVNVLKDAGIIETKAESADELGAKVLQAEENGMTIETFDGDYEKYQKAVENTKVSDASKWKEEEKALKAIEYTAGQAYRILDDKSADLVVGIVKHQDYFNSTRVKDIVENDKNFDFKGASEYLDGKYTGFMGEEIRQQMVEAEMRMNPGLSENDAIETIDDMRAW